MVPLLLHRFSTALPSRRWRHMLAAVCVAVALVDGWFCREALTPPEPEATLNLPGWTPWLSRQPKAMRAAIIPIIPEHYMQSYWWFFHRHDVLNTCDIRYCQEEVLEAGGPKDEAISVELIAVLRKRGYELLIVDEDIWQRYPWLEERPDVELVSEGDRWRAYRLALIKSDDQRKNRETPVQATSD